MNDPIFADGHYVEDWEIQRFADLSAPIRAFLASQACQGNKVVSIAGITVTLEHALLEQVFDLPTELSFICPIQHIGTRVYDGDEDGLIMNPNTNEIVLRSGYEKTRE